jgi:hypothetical protein
VSGEINWEAYSHEQLHQMLWQDADVGDVSKVADEWTRHREALDTHAAVLREQRVALLEGWHGAAAEEAAARLTKLAERIEKISELAAAGQQAAQDSADALAAARAAMPAPPAGTTMPAFAGLPAGPAPFALPSAPAPMTLPSAPPTSPSGFYFYFGAASADQQKAQAVRAMQTYESSLNGSGRLIDDARGNIPQAAPSPTRVATTAVKTPSSGGVPWQRLVGGGSGGSVATTRGPVIGAVSPVSQQAQLSPGLRTGVMFGHAVGPTITGSPIADTRSAAQNSGMAPPPGGARKDDDQPHENQMPTLDHGLFVVNERVSPAVIGGEQ